MSVVGNPVVDSPVVVAHNPVVVVGSPVAVVDSPEVVVGSPEVGLVVHSSAAGNPGEGIQPVVGNSWLAGDKNRPEQDTVDTRQQNVNNRCPSFGQRKLTWGSCGTCPGNEGGAIWPYPNCWEPYGAECGDGGAEPP